MKKIISLIFVVSMVLLCSVSVFAKDEDPKETYIQLSGNYSLANGFELSLSGEYHNEDIYHLIAKLSSDFRNDISLSLHNDIRLFYISDYKIGAKINYDRTNFLGLDLSASKNEFELGIYANKLFADKVDVTFGIITKYTLIRRLNQGISISGNGFNVHAEVDYEVNDKLNLKLNLESDAIPFKDVSAEFKANYKLTGRWSLNGSIDTLYSRSSGFFRLGLSAGVTYKVKDKLNLSLSVRPYVVYYKNSIISQDAKNTYVRAYFNADYEITDKLKLFFTLSGIRRSTPSKNVSAYFGVNYKVTDRLSLNSNIDSTYSWVPNSSLSLIFKADAIYKFDFGLSLNFGVEGKLKRSLSNNIILISYDVILKSYVRYTF